MTLITSSRHEQWSNRDFHNVTLFVPFSMTFRRRGNREMLRCSQMTDNWKSYSLHREDHIKEKKEKENVICKRWKLTSIGEQWIVGMCENPKILRAPATLQCCIAAYKICKYTIRFLLPVKLLETRVLRTVWPNVNERVTACLVLGHCVRCWAVSLRNSGSSDVYFKICVNLIKIKNR